MIQIRDFPYNLRKDIIRSKYKLTAGEDQLPQERANVTKGSDHSNPNMLRAFISSFFAAFPHVC
jgi:hypothetical protein